MKRKLIFDASVLVTGSLSGNIFKTGIYRVSYELLSEIIATQQFSVYLFDIYLRERELRKYVAPQFKNVEILPVDSLLLRRLAYPLFNFADLCRIRESRAKGGILSYLNYLLKNIFQNIGKSLVLLERLRNYKRIPVRVGKNDVYLSTYNKLPESLPFLAEANKVIYVHDLLPVIHPEYFFDDSNKSIFQGIINSISKNDTIICVSESTKRDLISSVKTINVDKIYVTPLAGSSHFHPNLSVDRLQRVKVKYNIPVEKEFFLSVCTLEPRKNIGLLLSAYNKMLEQGTNRNHPILILTGALGWRMQPVIKKIEDINQNFTGAIILTGYVPDEELAVLYSNTLAFIYPSMYEGFGLPPLEAMKCGAPVITSDNSSLPEVVGDAGIMINARDEAGLLEAMKTCLDSSNVKAMKERSLRQASLFSWEKTVRTLLEVIDEV